MKMLSACAWFGKFCPFSGGNVMSKTDEMTVFDIFWPNSAMKPVPGEPVHAVLVSGGNVRQFLTIFHQKFKMFIESI